VLDEAGVDIEETEPNEDDNESSDDLEQFRAFLEEVNPEDFS
jgi:hypothetical protein